MEEAISFKKAVEAQRRWFETGATLPWPTRRKSLESLCAALRDRERDILQALQQDLGKSAAESYMTDLGLVQAELGQFIRRLKSWAAPRRVRGMAALWPGKGHICPEPFGLTLILAPWNYPFQLAMLPLAAAVAAGNCVILAPSASAPATAAVLENILGRVFAPEHVLVANGGVPAAEALLEERFDFIFYTGSTRVGRKIMAAAARNLTPVCLELGGKSPVIVAGDAKIGLAARRIAWGKILNAGQTCVAPDYIWAERRIQAELKSAIEAEFTKMLGANPLANPDYPRIITESAFDRLLGLVDQPPPSDRAALKIAPQVFYARPEDPVMREEIFGPLLPLLAYDDIREAVEHIRSGEKPLAFYVFTENNRLADELMESISFGGGCVNDVVMHAASVRLPFGGVGASGMGRYHGRAGFDLFSNQKGILRQSSRLDPPFRYQPYGKNRLRLLRLFLR